MTIRTVDLFCGAGGSSWGAKNAGASIVAGVELSGLALECFADNFPGAEPVLGEIGARSPEEVLGDVGQVELLLASPECTNHTCARGARPSSETSRMTAWHVLAYIDLLQPRWLVLENVVHMRRWARYTGFIERLERSGYNVLPQVLDAASFGVPQTRRRLFIIADRKGQAPDLTAVRCPGRTVKGILDVPGIHVSRPLYSERRAAPTLARAERAIKALGRGVPFLIVYYGSDAAGGWQTLDRPLRTITTLDRFGLVTWEEGEPMLRMLQVSELRRAMGFDEAFKLNFGTRRDRIRLLGNGVCPPVMSAIVARLTGSRNHSVQTSRQRTLPHDGRAMVA